MTRARPRAAGCSWSAPQGTTLEPDVAQEAEPYLAVSAARLAAQGLATETAALPRARAAAYGRGMTVGVRWSGQEVAKQRAGG